MQNDAAPLAAPGATRPGRSPVLRYLLAAIATVLCVGLVLLGNWQVQRRIWKLDLIERVDQRVHAAAVPAPAEAAWPTLSAAQDEYRHVWISGVLVAGKDTLVQAVTERGAGFWVLTPLRLPDGSAVLVNRGFIETETVAAFKAAQSQKQSDGADTTVTGLLRWTEPGGGFLRHNDAANQRWYSRDVQAIAAALRLQRVAPYFIDADAASPAVGSDAVPVGGLTVVSFHNNHLVYAITWYALALMALGAAVYLLREGRANARDGR